jgi:isovaleryl-CoA dehydrogenase
MMRNLEMERVTLAAMSLGIALRCLREMVRYADQRVAFGRPIRDFGQIQRYIADSYAQWRAARSYVYDVARRMDLSRAGNRVDSDGVKLVAATMGKEVADRAIQVLGGNGYVGEFVVERLWRDAKLLEIGGGTIEAHQKNMTKDLARAQDTLLR